MMLSKKGYIVQDKEVVSTEADNLCGVKFNDADESKKKDNKRIIGLIDKTLSKKMDLYDMTTFWIKLENAEFYDEIVTYTVEIPVKE